MTRDSSDGPNRPTTDRRTRLDGDERGVSEILGAILLFGVVLMLVVLIQVSAVPGWNQQVEYEHNQRLQEDMQEFERVVAEAARTGDGGSVLLELGVRYPPRPFLFNPAPTVGTVDTGPPGSVTLANADLVGVDNVWAGGSSPAYPTRAVRYRPSYSEYRNAPVSVYETGLLYNDYNGTVLQRTEADIVDGQELTLLTVTGDLEESSTTPERVDVEALSGATQTVPVRSQNGSFVTVRLSTRLNEEQWRKLLVDELDGGAPGTDDTPEAYIASLSVETGTPLNTLVLQLEPGPAGDRNVYNLRMAKLGVGENTDPAGAHYITNVTAGGTSGDGVETRKLTVEVRNAYHNPVDGATVTFERTSGNGVFVRDDGSTVAGPVTVTTNENGRATVEYRAVTDSTVVAGGDLDDSGSRELPREQVTFSVRRNTDTSSDNGSTDDSGLNPAGTESVVLVDSETNTYDCTQNRRCNVNLTLENRNTAADRTISEARINFFYTSASTTPPETARMFSRSLTIGGSFVQFSSAPAAQRTIPAGQQRTVSVRFYPDAAAAAAETNAYGLPQNGFFAVTVIYQNGQTSTYLVDTR